MRNLVPITFLRVSTEHNFCSNCFSKNLLLQKLMYTGYNTKVKKHIIKAITEDKFQGFNIFLTWMK